MNHSSNFGSGETLATGDMASHIVVLFARATRFEDNFAHPVQRQLSSLHLLVAFFVAQTGYNLVVRRHVGAYSYSFVNLWNIRS